MRGNFSLPRFWRNPMKVKGMWLLAIVSAFMMNVAHALPTAIDLTGAQFSNANPVTGGAEIGVPGYVFQSGVVREPGATAIEFLIAEGSMASELTVTFSDGGTLLQMEVFNVTGDALPVHIDFLSDVLALTAYDLLIATDLQVSSFSALRAFVPTLGTVGVTDIMHVGGTVGAPATASLLALGLLGLALTRRRQT